MNLEGVRGETGTNTHNVILGLWKRIRKTESALSLLQINNEFQVKIDGLNGMCVIQSTTEPPIPTEPCMWIKIGGAAATWFVHSGEAGSEWIYWKTD